jgi:predicted transcriptional regulator
MNNTEKFGKTESDKRVEKINECRAIVKKVIDYGVDNDQILTIIRLFALELEKQEHCVQIIELIKSFEQKILFTDEGDEYGTTSK